MEAACLRPLSGAAQPGIVRGLCVRAFKGASEQGRVPWCRGKCRRAANHSSNPAYSATIKTYSAPYWFTLSFNFPLVEIISRSASPDLVPCTQLVFRWGWVDKPVHLSVEH